jgi:magnesium and cobalt transporter
LFRGEEPPARSRERDQIAAFLGECRLRELLDATEHAMLLGVLEVSKTQVRDIMVPRSHMVVLPYDDPPEALLKTIVESGHSRFPVINGDRDQVIGILLAKDLLKFFGKPLGDQSSFSLEGLLRPAVFIPESKRLNTLLTEFRESHNHMALVVDEYGGVAGLVTIEDVLEQIVGDIEDEYDFDEASDNILPEQGGRYRVKALTQIADFNSAFGTRFPDEAADTIGGFLIKHLGRLPKRGESVLMDGLRFQVLRADSRRVYTLLVDKPKT